MSEVTAYTVLAFLVGLVIGLVFMIAFAVFVERVKDEEMDERLLSAVQAARKQGRLNISGYRPIGNTIVRAYVKDRLAGSSVREVISHIQHVGLESFNTAVYNYAYDTNGTHGVSADELAESIMDLVCIYESRLEIDGFNFDPYAPTPDIFKVLYF